MPEVLAQDVGQAYLRLHKRLHRMLDEAMTATGISLARAKVLAELDEHGRMNQSALAARLGFAPRSITDTVDLLQRDGFAERVSDPADRRAWIVAITPAGTVALGRAQSAKATVFDQAFGSLEPGLREQILAALNQIDHHLTSPAGETCAS